MPEPYADLLYAGRRERLLIQVIARWTGIDYNDNEAVNAKAQAAADATYHGKINDLDWQAATLRRLGYEGTVL
jgi:alkylhydroperoxidase family enzyme